MSAVEVARTAVLAGRGRNLRRVLGALSLALALGLIGGAGAAFAENIHTANVGSYGKEAEASTGTGNSCRITYQAAEKRLYLLSDSKIYGLEITSPGTAVQLPGYPLSPEIGFPFCTGSDIQVDNTNGPSKGRYYTSAGGQSSNEITAFEPDGTKLTTPWPALATSLCSLAVLPNGDVWGWSQFPQPATIARFNYLGEPLSSLATNAGGCPQMAIDPTTGDLYRVGYSQGFSKYGLTRYTAESNYTDATYIAPASEFRDYAINGALRKAYIATSSGVEVFSVDDGEWLETISTGGEARSLSLDEATDTLFVEVGEQSSGRIKEYPAHIVPNATTVSATGEGLASGSVEALTNGPVTSCSVEYGLSAAKRGEAYEHSISCSPATPYAEASTTPITAQLTGLVGETTYHYRVVAANATGSGYGKDKTFVPHYVQNVVTESCSAVSTSSATLNASFDGNGEDTHYFFEWGLKGKPYEHTTPDTDIGSPAVHTPVSEPISGLTSDSVYHYRAVMTNPKGTSPGNDVECASANAVTALTTEAVSNLTSSSATLNASWEGNGEDTHYFYEWGFATGSGFEHSTPSPAADGGNSAGHQSHPLSLTGLASDATYRFRIIASNGKGTSTGETLTFKTFKFPSVQYLQPTKEEPTSLQLNTLVNPNGGGATTFHYDYGTTTAYGSSTPESASIGSDSTFHEASQVIAGLSPGTKYHYRIVATGPGGPYEGEDQTFTTLPVAPTVTDSTVTERSPTAARVSADVKPGFGPTVVYFEYGQTAAYGSATIPGAPLAADNDSHQVSAKLSGLAPDTTYHYKVVAINFNGSATSPDLTFATGGPPRVSAESASSITETTARLSALVNPNLSNTTYHVEYGPTSAYGFKTGESALVGGDETNHSVSEDLTGLSPGTTYHYRVVATNGVGSTPGGEATFTTAMAPKTEAPPPAVHCKKGFVKRHGKCVKRKKPRKRHGRRAGSR